MRSVRARRPWIISKEHASPAGATDNRAAVFCRSFGPEFLLLAIQGLRARYASHWPLAIFEPRLRRSRVLFHLVPLVRIPLVPLLSFEDSDQVVIRREQQNGAGGESAEEKL